MPLVSVVMAVYNGEKYLAEAIESILTQSFSDFELIIVDDGSTDGSGAVIHSFRERDKRIRFFQLDKNSGASAARNHGIARARGQFVTTMDSDDVSLPQRLEKQVRFLQANPKIGGVGAHRRVVSHDLSLTLYPHVLSRQHALIALDWFISPMFMGATLMIRREFLLAIGGYEAELRRGEDSDLVARLLDETPIRLANLSDVLYLHRRHGHSVDTSPGTAPYKAHEDLLRRALQKIWNDASNESFERICQLRRACKLNWAERRATKRDLLRLIESMINAKWVKPSDRPPLLTAVNRRLEQTSPRPWQQFCHWRRHRLGF